MINRTLIVVEDPPDTFTEVVGHLETEEFKIPELNLALWNEEELAEHNCYRFVLSSEKDGKPLKSYSFGRVAGVVQLLAVYEDTPAEDPKVKLQNQIVAAVQARLDDFAKTKGYDGILSACTYFLSSVPAFASDGLYCVSARDQTWSKLYDLLAEIEAGTRPIPTSYADIEPELPVLEWPQP